MADPNLLLGICLGIDLKLLHVGDLQKSKDVIDPLQGTHPHHIGGRPLDLSLMSVGMLKRRRILPKDIPIIVLNNSRINIKLIQETFMRASHRNGKKSKSVPLQLDGTQNLNQSQKKDILQ